MRELQELTAQLIGRDGEEAPCLGFVITEKDLPPKLQGLSPEDLEDFFDYLNYESDLLDLLYQQVTKYLESRP